MKNITDRLATQTYQTSLLHSRAHRALTSYMGDTLNKNDLSLPQWGTLGVLYDNTSLRPFQIAAFLGVRPPVATALINDLEAKKLVIRRAHSNDSRASVIELTRQGKNLVAKIEKQLNKEMQTFFGDVALPELIVYMRVLTKIAAKV